MGCGEHDELAKFADFPEYGGGVFPDVDASVDNFACGQADAEHHVVGHADVFVAVNKSFIHVKNDRFLVEHVIWLLQVHSLFLEVFQLHRLQRLHKLQRHERRQEVLLVELLHIRRLLLQFANILQVGHVILNFLGFIKLRVLFIVLLAACNYLQFLERVELVGLKSNEVIVPIGDNLF